MFEGVFVTELERGSLRLNFEEKHEIFVTFYYMGRIYLTFINITSLISNSYNVN